MTFYNTGNPVPSIDPRDLDDNAKHIDELANSTFDTFVDRKGVTRKTLHGIENDNALLSANLAAPTGSSLVGYGSITVEEALSSGQLVDKYGADPTGLTASDAAFAAAFAENTRVILRQGGVYIVNTPIVLKTNQILDVTGALLQCGPSWADPTQSPVKITTDGISGGVDLPSWNVNVIGNGKIDCAFRCNYAIEVVFARECDIKVQMLTRGRLGGVIAGTHATQTSTGINCVGVSAWFHEEYAPQPGYEINNASGVGIYHKNCSDSYNHMCYSIGYRKGFLSGYSIDYVSCHAWSRRAHGPLVKCFETIGDDGSFIGCYADTPHNWKWVSGYAGGTIVYAQDGTITEVIGFDHSGTTVNVIGCKTLIQSDPNLGATDGLVIPIGFPVAGNTFGIVSGLSLAGGTTITRYKSVYKNFDSTATIVGYRDKGSDRFVDQSNRGNILSSSRGLKLVIPTFESAGLINSVGTGSSALAFRKLASNRWETRMNSGTEAGSNAGSDYSINAYNDAGSFLRTAITIKRDTGIIFLEGGPLKLKTYTIATLPTAVGNVDCFIAISDPAAGKGRLIYSDNTIWRYVSDATAV